MGKSVKVLLIANLCLWIYFWIGFARASYAYQPNPLGHPAGTGYTFWGHSIAVAESGLKYPFFKITFYLELPSFVVAVSIERFFDPQLISHRFIWGISMAGWGMLATILLSFLQWWSVGWIAEKVWRTWFNHTTRLPSSTTPTAQ